ncbi:MAG: saccharopine dehydrogenase C-terminal domain-containing protein [Myxococcota bacterium]|nr:saccharopine dehydrogenase C-terminal domain-containing protein [Myxococcota bacterium]
MKIIVLGAGLIGGPMAVDLSKQKRFDVTAVDVDPAATARLADLHPSIAVRNADLSQASTVSSIVSDFDLVLSAVPGFLGYETLKAVIQVGKPVVDIAFFPEDPFELDDLAKKNRVTAIVDCGVAPGMSNILTGYAHARLDRTREVLIYVGGLPEHREWPYEYKAVFSPIDVIEEYTRPARFVQNGSTVVRPALSDPERLTFPGIGTLEAFNTDGLRTLAQTIDAPHMKEKTLRYPGHIEKMAVLRETGFFSTEAIDVGGTWVRPIDMTAKLLFPKWQLNAGDRDLTVMQVQITGEKNGTPCRYTFDLLDRYDPETQTHSMARTTGYTGTVVLTMLAEGLYDKVGISPPEYLGKDSRCVDYIFNGLSQRGVHYKENFQVLA